MGLVEIALGFIAAYGLWAMFVLLVLDGAMLLPVFPGEIVLIMAVTAYAVDPASLILIMVIATAAGMLGSLILYGICRGGGRSLVERYPRLFMMPRKRRERLERLFRKPAGQSLVMFLRVVPLTRILVNIPAGLAKMPFVRFVILSAIGLTVYHVGFLWFTYEVNRDDSAVGGQADALKAAYASPAWEFVEANMIVAGAFVLLIGAALSVKASINVSKDPEESTGSLIGMLARWILLWGGIGLAVATYMDPDLVYAMAGLGGFDVESTAARLGVAPVQFLAATAAIAIVLGFAVGRASAAARRARRGHAKMKRKEKTERLKKAMQAGVRTEDDMPAADRDRTRDTGPKDITRPSEVEFVAIERPAAGRHADGPPGQADDRKESRDDDGPKPPTGSLTPERNAKAPDTKGSRKRSTEQDVDDEP